MTARKPEIALALDVANQQEALAWVKKTKGLVDLYKVGLQLFTAEGPGLVKAIQKEGGKIFLDLKFHDIPQTVQKACESAAALGVDLLTIHALGGVNMMQAAAKVMQSNPLRIVAVTALTSHSEEAWQNQVGQKAALANDALRLAQNAKAAGLAGVVCSALEAKNLKTKLGDDFVLVTPGIRLSGGNADDQERVATPELAVQNGSHVLVLGRAVTESKEPCVVLQNIRNDIKL
ncbi:MAG: orotidine-5'-phosphate decarboxylase [Deltaproteobacteria bacterium]|nr:orotidine-5'-phosphate decarboxylase [Deltaproteobacteria bacterium]